VPVLNVSKYSMLNVPILRIPKQVLRLFSKSYRFLKFCLINFMTLCLLSSVDKRVSRDISD
jgi:hypothetical protein